MDAHTQNYMLIKNELYTDDYISDDADMQAK